ncbi:hypothetical protein KIN20_026860 [Parelaphostrongylus tenuis]|uniref:Uncharacterized protein n=1 Tax=Parelaphostrongylus tenuis TaxID=148309 RepID=A0AAD5WDG7_PARTN|nr:hypothetical protein KIN20_026860 [Parelaphostrongylus tenuis]
MRSFHSQTTPQSPELTSSSQEEPTEKYISSKKIQWLLHLSVSINDKRPPRYDGDCLRSLWSIVTYIRKKSMKKEKNEENGTERLNKGEKVVDIGQNEMLQNAYRAAWSAVLFYPGGAN